MSGWTLFGQQVVNGVTIGMIYALIAIGYSMVYGIIQLINFAHGEIFVVGSFLGLAGLLVLGTPAPMAGMAGWAVALGLALMVMAGCGVLGYAVERAAYRPLRRAPRLACLISAIGVSFVLQNAVMLLAGPHDRYLPSVLPDAAWTVGGVRVTLMQVVIIGVTLGSLVGFQWWVRGTVFGAAMRATSQDVMAAQLMGIPSDRVIGVTFIVGSVLAGVGGLCYGFYYHAITFHDGYLVGLKAFTAAVLGGIGNLPGAMVGGLLLGLAETLGAGYVSSQWKHVVAFVVLVGVLLCRPSGLLGERVARRV